MKTIEEIVKLGDENKASDIHFSCGSPVMYRIDGEVQKLDDDVLSFEDCEQLGKRLAQDHFDEIKAVVSERNKRLIQTIREIESYKMDSKQQLFIRNTCSIIYCSLAVVIFLGNILITVLK